jgi:membrane protease YdiL (CAAX protease family)
MSEVPHSAGATRLQRALGWLPVRLVVLFVALALLDLACQIVAQLLTPKSAGALRDSALLVGAAILSVAMIAAYRYLVGVTEHRATHELAAAGAARNLGLGIAAGMALFGLVYGIIYLAGGVSFHGFGGWAGLATALAIGIASAVGEELVFRGVLYRLLEEGTGTTFALVASAAVFGLIHAGNHGATLLSTVAIAAESGVLMCLAYSATRTLWVPIGLHFGWNFTEGGIFGAAVSGGHYSGLVASSLSGPATLTGGEFGPEASLPAIMVCIPVSLILVFVVVRAGRWRAWGLQLRAQAPRSAT